jgi:hypothetical protein
MVGYVNAEMALNVQLVDDNASVFWKLDAHLGKRKGVIHESNKIANSLDQKAMHI